MADLDDLTPGTRVKHLPTGAEGVVTAGRARLRDGLRGSVAWTGDETDPWRVYVRYWPCDGCPTDWLDEVVTTGKLQFVFEDGSEFPFTKSIGKIES